MLPLLKFLRDGKEHSKSEAVDFVSNYFKLSKQEREESVPSGGQKVIKSRIGWASTYLKKAGLLEAPKRGFLRVTQRGRDVLAENPQKVDDEFLERYPEFVEFKQIGSQKKKGEPLAPYAFSLSEENYATQTPQEIFETAYLGIQQNLSDELLETIGKCSPEFFERLVVDLLVRMGYGGSRKEAGKAIGKSGDGGIDGIIKEDKFGLDVIYIQAKRWQAQVGRPEVQKFVGALHGQKAGKGIFITTSNFSKEALDYAEGIKDLKFVLVDGDMLAQQMIDYDIGVSTDDTFSLKKIDADYFEED